MSSYSSYNEKQRWIYSEAMHESPLTTSKMLVSKPRPLRQWKVSIWCLPLSFCTLLTWKYTFSILSWLSSVIGENSIHIKLSLPTSIWPTFGPLSLLDFVFHTPFGRSDDQYTSTHNMTWANTITWCKIMTWWYPMSWCYPITWERGSPGHYRAVVHSQWMVFYDVKVNMDNQLMGGSPANTTVLWTNSTKSCFFIGFLITLLLNLQFRSNTECNKF